jgi:hypothetical protein
MASIDSNEVRKLHEQGYLRRILRFGGRLGVFFLSVFMITSSMAAAEDCEERFAGSLRSMSCLLKTLSMQTGKGAFR